MDNHSCYKNVCNLRDQLKIKEFSANCASVHQPVDQDIIKAWEIWYKSKLLAVRVGSMGSTQQLREARARRMKKDRMLGTNFPRSL